MSAFNQIPDNLRIPGVRVEFDPSGATTGVPQISRKVLVLGQRLSTGAVAAGVPTRITTDGAADDAFGRGSMLAAMLKAARQARPYLEFWGLALDELGAGVAADGQISLAAASVKAGVLTVYIAGQRIQVGVAAGATAAALATALAAAVNANDTLPVTAAVNGVDDFKVDLTCRWKGETGNAIDLRLNYYQGENTPAGLTVTLTPMANGAGNPDVTAAIAAFGPEWWNYIVMPWTDTANLNALAAEAVSRWGAMRALDTQVFAAFRGTHSATATFGNGRNDYPVTIMGTGLSPTAPWIWAAVNAAVAAESLNNSPARPLRTLTLPGILPPAIQDQFTDEERNLLLFDGISTYVINADGTVAIEMQITTYQVNAAAVPDTSWLKVQTLAINSYLRFARRTRLSKFARFMLAKDGTQFDPTQPVVTPSMLRDELLALFRDLEHQALVEGFEQYKRDLVVQIDANNPNRVNVFESPDHVNQLDLVAMQISWIN